MCVGGGGGRGGGDSPSDVWKVLAFAEKNAPMPCALRMMQLYSGGEEEEWGGGGGKDSIALYMCIVTEPRGTQKCQYLFEKQMSYSKKYW